jgi:hypothetical protein
MEKDLEKEKRFNESIIKLENGCWEWNRHINMYGYGLMCFRKKRELAHRVSYSIFKGNVPKESLVCHKCDNRKCANPDHLFLGTHKDNTRDMMSKNRHRFLCGEEVSTKLNSSDVKFIFMSDETCYFLAKKFGVGETIIRNIRKRTKWKKETENLIAGNWPKTNGDSRKRNKKLKQNNLL